MNNLDAYYLPKSHNDNIIDNKEFPGIIPGSTNRI